MHIKIAWFRSFSSNSAEDRHFSTASRLPSATSFSNFCRWLSTSSQLLRDVVDSVVWLKVLFILVLLYLNCKLLLSCCQAISGNSLSLIIYGNYDPSQIQSIMFSASPYTFLSPLPNLYGAPQRDLNIFVLKFDGARDAEKNIGAGDPFHCQSCNVCLSKFSKLLTKQEYSASQKELPKELPKIEEVKIEESVFQEKLHKPAFIELGAKDMAWVCEFCGTHNRLQIEKEEIPVEADMVYIVESASQKGTSSVKDSTIVFCIDNSGSMNATQQVKGKLKLKHGVSEHELQMLRQFMEPGDQAQLHFFPGQNAANTYISRKQCVMAAIENQLNETLKTDPNKRIGLVTFNNEVVIFGDCTEDSKHILGDKLNKKVDIMADLAPLKIKNPLKESYDKILLNINKIEASGATSLGPAVLSAIQLAGKGSPGSAVVICTDGLANIGLGSLDPVTEEGKQFYEELSLRAQQHNIIVNIVTIKGEGCKLEALSSLAKATNGNVSIVDPEHISEDFANILKDQVVGINVHVKIKLPNMLRFRHEAPQNIKENGSVLIRQLPNVTVDTKISFEYEVKPEQELKKLGIDIKNLKKVPFQAQVIYTSPEGHRYLRVVTQECQTTTDQKLMERQARLGVVHARVAQTSTSLMNSGQEQEATAYNNRWANYLATNLSEANPQAASANIQFLQKNDQLAKAYKHKKLKRKIQEKKEIRKKAEEGIQEKPMNLSDEEEELEKQLNKSAIDSDEDERIFHDFHQAKKFK